MKHSKREKQRGDYEVGYGRPPHQHQFKKGQRSANPTGRPRRTRSPNLVEVLLEPVSIKIQGRTRKVPYLEAYAQVMKDKAIKGDIKAGQMLLLLAKQLKLLDVPDIPDNYEFTLKLGGERPPHIRPPKSDGEADE